METADPQGCLVCNAALTSGTSLNVFYTCLPRNGESLANFVLQILQIFPSSEPHGSHVCLRCYDLFRTLDEAQWTALNAKAEIQRIYRSADRREKITEIHQVEEFSEATVTIESAESGEQNYEESSKNSPILTERPLAIEANDCQIEAVADNRSSPEITENSSEDNFPKDFLKDSDPANLASGAAEVVAGSVEKESGIDADGESKKSSKYMEKSLKYSCTSCDKKWRTSSELRSHIKSHSNLRPYMCEKCGQAYKHKHALEIHVGMHNGVSPFRCNVCKKCFTQKGALMRHLPIHTGETPYQCELCGKRFVHHTSYNMHALSHTGKKSYQCHICDLSLLSTSHLKRHMRVHTGEKPYSCQLCGKSFAERYNLFAHKKIHDPAEIMAKAAKKVVLKCDRCDEQFDKKQKLEEHARQHEMEIKAEKEWLGDTIAGTNSAKISRPSASDHLPVGETSPWHRTAYENFSNPTSQCDEITEITQESISIFMSQENFHRGLEVASSQISVEIDRNEM